jgi:hypothetical protein
MDLLLHKRVVRVSLLRHTSSLGCPKESLEERRGFRQTRRRYFLGRVSTNRGWLKARFP